MLASYPSLGPGPPLPPRTGKMYMGAHVSSAGGIHNVFANAKVINAKSFAMFTRSPRQWNIKPFIKTHVEQFLQLSKVGQLILDTLMHEILVIVFVGNAGI